MEKIRKLAEKNAKIFFARYRIFKMIYKIEETS